MLEIITLVLIAYLMGSIPFSLIIVHIATREKVDLTQSGTGNVGIENA